MDNDSNLKQAAIKIKDERQKLGLQGLVGSLQAIIINTEIDNLQHAANEMIQYTNFSFNQAFETAHTLTIVLKCPGSAAILFQARKSKDNPFSSFNHFPKSKHLINTRLETFVFETFDIQSYHSIQKERGVDFLTNAILEGEDHYFIQTKPSEYTSNSLGFIQWKNGKTNYKPSGASELDINLTKPKHPYLLNIGLLDHAATRVRAKDREKAILEFVSLTNYDFDFAIYVNPLNSITSVVRMKDQDFALVFTSGIASFISEDQSGPTEKFIHNYGTRTHHLAFQTENIEQTFEELKNHGVTFLKELTGSPEEGLKQTFTNPSSYTLILNEYIHRYGDFDGFFTQSNVTALTEATNNQ